MTTDSIPFTICWLFLTFCTAASSVSVKVTEEAGEAWQPRYARRIDVVSASDSGDWKPIDYGHPMRDDPTLVYVPPVVDPVHYGIHSAEPLWPIRAQKLPAFHLPPEAMFAAASTDRHWRPQPTGRPKPIGVASARSSTQTSQQRSNQGIKLATPGVRPVQRPQPQTQYHRYPVRSTAWKGYDRSTNRPIGRSPAVITTLPSNIHTRHAASHQFTGRQNTLQEVPAPHRFVGSGSGSVVASSGRNFGSISSSGSSVSSSHIGNIIIGASPRNSTAIGSIDRVDDSSDTVLLNETPVESHRRNETLLDASHEKTNRYERKRARKPFFPFQFVIQQGHSRVRKYSNGIKELIS